MGSYVTTRPDHMAMTNAEKQAAFRQRRDARIAELEAENERLRNQGGDGEVSVLKRKLASVESTLGLAIETIKILKASNKRLRNGESIALVKLEEPASLDWWSIDDDMQTASHPAHLGSYFVCHGEQGFEAVFGRAPARPGGRKKQFPLGNFATIA